MNDQISAAGGPRSSSHAAQVIEIAPVTPLQIGNCTRLISAEFRGGLRLQVRPPSASSKIAVTCRPGGQAIAAEGYWFAPDRVRGPYEDGVALGSYPAESTDAPCGSS